jgi:hypothetical protein
LRERGPTLAIADRAMALPDERRRTTLPLAMTST